MTDHVIVFVEPVAGATVDDNVATISALKALSTVLRGRRVVRWTSHPVVDPLMSLLFPTGSSVDEFELVAQASSFSLAILVAGTSRTLRNFEAVLWLRPNVEVLPVVATGGVAAKVGDVLGGSADGGDDADFERLFEGRLGAASVPCPRLPAWPGDPTRLRSASLATLGRLGSTRPPASSSAVGAPAVP